MAADVSREEVERILQGITIPPRPSLLGEVDRELGNAEPDLRRTAALIGTQAVVMETVDGSTGRIKLAGEIWSARAFDEEARFEPGQKVSVFEIDGATAVVG